MKHLKRPVKVHSWLVEGHFQSPDPLFGLCLKMDIGNFGRSCSGLINRTRHDANYTGLANTSFTTFKKYKPEGRGSFLLQQSA